MKSKISVKVNDDLTSHLNQAPSSPASASYVAESNANWISRQQQGPPPPLLSSLVAQESSSLVSANYVVGSNVNYVSTLYFSGI